MTLSMLVVKYIYSRHKIRRDRRNVSIEKRRFESDNITHKNCEKNNPRNGQRAVFENI